MSGGRAISRGSRAMTLRHKSTMKRKRSNSRAERAAAEAIRNADQRTGIAGRKKMVWTSRPQLCDSGKRSEPESKQVASKTLSQRLR